MQTDKEIAELILSGKPLEQRRLGGVWEAKTPGIDSTCIEYRVIPPRFTLEYDSVRIWNPQHTSSAGVRSLLTFRRMAKLVIRARKTGKAVRLPQKLYGFSGYIYKNGNSRVGCQKFTWEEVSEFAREQGWM